MITMSIDEVMASLAPTRREFSGLCSYGLSEIIGTIIQKKTDFKLIPSAHLDAFFEKSNVQKSKSVCETVFSAAIECKILFRTK